MKFYLYILRQLLMGFFFSAAGMVFIAMPGMAVGAVHKLGGAGTLAVLKFVPMMVAVFVPYVLPVALLLALVSTYGRLAAQNEWTAMRMAGVNPYRLLIPAVLLALGAGSGVFALNSQLLPRIKVWQKTAQLRELKGAFRSLSRGKTDLDIRQFHLSSTYRNPEEPDTFYDCFIEFPSQENDELKSFFAEAVRFEFDDDNMNAILYGSRGTFGHSEGGGDVISFAIDIDTLTENNKKVSLSSSRYQTSFQLRRSLKKLDQDEAFTSYFLSSLGMFPGAAYFESCHRTRRRLLYAWHQRIANAATCLMFVLVGVSTGVILRKGTQLSALAVAVGYAMVYWVSSLRLGKQLAQNGAIEAWLGAWGPLALFTLIGVWLTRRAFRE
ncbi:MAG: lipopolysaccharide export LptBFGC system permease protein LptF [Planctomycetota bacterium]|jgi:lipopolysaccharide export LptBFGC system permease protein LptF